MLVEKVGFVASDEVSAIGMGCRFASQGYAVRIFTPQTDLDRLPEHLGARRTDVAIIVAPAGSEQYDRASAALERWGAGPPTGDAQTETEPPASFDPLAELDVRGPGGTLVLIGSAAPGVRAQIDRLADDGALVLTLRRELVLGQDETQLMGLRSGAAATAEQGRNVVVRSENWPEAVEMTRRMAAKRGTSAEELGNRVVNMLARVGQGVISGAITTRGSTRRVIAVGTDTCAALCRKLGIGELLVLAEVEPGLPVVLAPGPEPLLLFLKAGSSGGPDTLAQAIKHLGQFQTKRGH
ncbi:MAG: four-carbon acid sugar kinase family protein [Firmicutes bacterium]|nr:four-carbon acid sugar kinase family protein [Bacillota bacterium]